MSLTLGVLWLAVSAWATPPPGLTPVGEGLWAEAIAQEQAGDLDRAAVAYGTVWRVEHHPAAALAQGRVLEQAERWTEAEQAYRQAVSDLDVGTALAELLLARDRVREADRLVEGLAGGYPGDPELARLQVLIAARLSPGRTPDLLQSWLGFARNEALDAEAAVEVAIAVHDALRGVGEVEAAAAALAAIDEAVPETHDALRVLRDRIDMQAKAERLARAAARPLTGAQRERLQAARAAQAQGEGDAALAQLDALVAEAPRNPDVRGARAEVRRSRGDVAGADVDLRTAEALDPLDPRWPRALGDLLSTGYAGRYDQQAVDAWERALRLDGGRAEVWLRRARVELRLRRPSAARRSLLRCQRLDPDGAAGAAAQDLLQDLERRRADPDALPAGGGCPDRVSEVACSAFYEALVYHRRDEVHDTDPGLAMDRDVALERIQAARADAPDWVRAINLEATIYRARAESPVGEPGDRARSLALYERSLELQPNQPSIWAYLGELRDNEGDTPAAVELWEKAVASDGAGGAPAHLYLAEHALESWRLWEARGQLDAYFAEAAPSALGDAIHDRATALDRRLDTIELSVFGAAGGAAALAIGVPVAWGLSRRRGASLATLLDRAPSAWRDVARILSAIRHEVLKHHTTVLDAVADALEIGDGEPASWAESRLYAPAGPLDRFDGYVRELEELGRRSGVRLDLRRQDPTFAPLLRAVDRLRAARGPLSRGSRRVAAELREISHALHTVAYPALGALIRRTCVLQLDEDLLRRVWEAVAGEPAFRGQTLPTLELEMPNEPVHLRIWKDELVDILVNVVRNAVQATLDAGEGRLGIAVGVEEDPITYLERVVVRVRDDAPRRISTAMIRSRYIEGGLGLTVDLISRNGGSIHVEDEPDWSKAVVVRLPRVEGEEEVT